MGWVFGIRQQNAYHISKIFNTAHEGFCDFQEKVNHKRIGASHAKYLEIMQSNTVGYISKQGYANILPGWCFFSFVQAKITFLFR